MTTIAGPVASTTAGEVVDDDDGRVAVWKGIRYGEAPTGALRWAAPVAAHDAVHDPDGVVRAASFGAVSQAVYDGTSLVSTGDAASRGHYPRWRPSKAGLRRFCACDIVNNAGNVDALADDWSGC